MRYTFRWLRAGSWISFFLTMACSAFASSVFGAELPPQIAWNANFDSGDTDAATAVAVGPDGNPVVTGYSGLQGRSIWRTIKYSGASGAALWNVIFDGGGSDPALGVAVGADGNPVVTGTCVNGECIRTIKYDGTTGAILWNVTFDGGTHLAAAVAVGNDGHPVVAGNFRVIKYDGATGSVRWIQVPPPGFFLSGVAVGPDGNPVISGDGCGGQGCSIVFKQNGSTGEYIWTVTDNGGAESVAIGADGHPVVGGSSCNPGCDFRATKYEGATGSVRWRTASNPGPGEPFGLGIAVGPDGNPVLTGATGLELPFVDVRTVKYDGASGAIRWNVTFDSGGNDVGRSVAIGPDNNPVVAGYSCDPGCDFRVIKYLEPKANILSVVLSGTNLTVTWEQLIPIEQCYVEVTERNSTWFSPGNLTVPCTTPGIYTQTKDIGFILALQRPLLETIIVDNVSGELISDFRLIPKANILSGEIIVSDGRKYEIFRVDPQTGAVIDQYGTGPRTPAGIAIDASGNIIVADVTGRTIFQLDPLTRIQTVISTGGNFVQPFGVALDAAGNIIVADNIGGAIIRVDPVTGAQAVISSGGNLIGPTGVALDAAGNIVAAAQGQNFAEGAIVRVDPVTGVQTVLSSGGNLVSPTALAFEADGHIIVEDQNATGQYSGAVIRVDPGTGANTIVTSGIVGDGVAVDAAGNIFVGTQYDGVVYRVDPITGAKTVFSSGGNLFLSPGFVAVVPSLVALPPNTVATSPATVFPDIRTSITFSRVFSPGNTTVTTSSSGPPAPTGFSLGDPAIYYDIRTTATFTGSVKVCIAYNLAAFADSSFLFHYENNAWVDVTTTRDTVRGVICGQVTSLSPFAVARVQDTTPPALSLPGNITAEATSPAGATVSFTATATDVIDGVRPVTCTPASGATFPIATTTANCSASDSHGNTAHGTFTVTVRDTTPPKLTLPANITTTATSAAGAAVSYTASASDIVDGTDAVSCTPASGSTFAPGTTTVSCSARDRAGNPASGSFTIAALFSWSNILQPVNTDGSSIFKLDSTVPVKFQLTGASAAITNLVARLFAAKVSDNVVGTAIEAVSTASADSGNTFRYDSSAHQYVFNWSTKGLSRGTWQLRIDLGDGTLHTVLISLK